MARALEHRLRRLEQVEQARAAENAPEQVEIWLPCNGRDHRPPGRYPCPGSNATLIIYDADDPTAADEVPTGEDGE
jgi:hypothetical protein